MAPSATSYDIWLHAGKSSRVIADILLPNGLLIPLEVNRDATLQEIKEDVWEEAQRYPLYGVLHDMQTYIFTCVNQTTAEQEELVDEQRRLCDVRPFQAILRLIEKKGDKAEKVLNTQIGLLIGKGLHEFDALKNPEVNDFRWKMRLLCEGIAYERENKTWLERVLHQYPLRVESNPILPSFLLCRIKDGNLVLGIKFDGTETRFKFCIPHTTTAKELLQQVLAKKAHITGRAEESVDDYVLKVCGREEYLLGTNSLSQYKYVRQMIGDGIVPELVTVSITTIRLHADNVYETLEHVEHRRCRSSFGNMQLSRKKQAPESAWTVTENFSFRVGSACCLNCDDSAKVAVQAGLFHGGEPFCELGSTKDVSVEDGECTWDEELQFELPVCDIPRMTRLCLVVYEVTRTMKGNKTRKYRGIGQDQFANPLAWVNTTIYDFKNLLKTGSVTLAMWTYAQDLQSEDMLHPLGTVVSNPNVENATALTITFNRYHPTLPVSYPSFDKILERAAEDMCQDADNTCHTPHASKTYLEQLRQICERDPLHQLHEQEKELMWFLRHDCRQHLPHSLPKLLRCVKWNDHQEVAQMIVLLQIWPRLPPEQSLELLDYAYAEQFVRSFAVSCLKDMSDEDLSLYLLQLVQALKHESYLQCDLVEFLLKRALCNQQIGHQLFWLLRSEMHVPSVSVRYGLILEAYCRGSVEHMKSLSRQMEALVKLRALSELIRLEASKRSREKLRTIMQESMVQNHQQDAFCNLQCLLNPSLRIKKLRLAKCRCMDSKMKPLWLVFENDDSYAQDIFVIYKYGDDLRQDMLTLQMFRIMDKLWKDENLDLRMIPYQCIATGAKEGLIEVVLNANTIANIQKEKGFTATSAFKKGSLLAWLKDHNVNEKCLNGAVEEFTLSCAGYCVATYVLGIADRHSDNIMVKTNGQLFHIDFGHILGRFKEKFGIKRERVPFVLTHDFVHVITRGHTQRSQEFARFQQYCEQAFLILRRKGSLIISLFAMMLSTGIPELTCEKDLNYLQDTLVLGMTESEAVRHFRSKFDEALRNSWKTSVNWLAHNLAKDNKMND